MGLEEDIKKQISQKKRDIRLDKFVNYALFNKHGYYFRKKPIGKKNDFITAPEISQMFGEIIGLYLYYIWKEKIKSYFNLIELGPGNGTLFKDIERSLIKYKDFTNSAKISFIEINNSLVNIQKKQINNNVFKNISWYKKINFGSKKPSIIYSNEFFDCFPVRQFIYKNIWLEKFISLNKKQNLLIYKFKKVNNLKLLNFLSKYKKEKILEISFERNKYFENICRHLKKYGGLFITIDYGYFDNIKNFTLQAIQNHKYSNILENIGEKDISSHVNFNDLKKIAIKYNLKIEEYCTQRNFLIKYGILTRFKKLNQSGNFKNLNIELKKLIGESEMGNLFKCLIVSRLK